MPLVHRRAVPLLPPPKDVSDLPADHPVFLLRATNEIFLDYEAYSSRMAYLSSPIFQCEFSGKSGLNYFAAVESEKAESSVVRERFPDELKGRVLFNVQFQVMGRLDALVDLIFDRYKDRFFAGEKVFVDLSGDKYFARIAKVFPPASIRALRQDDKPSTSAVPATTFDDYSSVCHKIGTDLNIEVGGARQQDDPDEYFYTVQLSDADLKFEGSFMEVKAKALSRDRLAFSKAIFKRYIRECVSRDAAVGSPWIVKPSIAAAFGIPTSLPDAMAEKNQQAKEAKLAKRRKPKDESDNASIDTKKHKMDYDAASSASADRKVAAPATKTPKYPIEDLDLDPMSIHDGRLLRRTKQVDLPPLPAKPQPSKEMLVPAELFESFITTWNLLNVFSRPLNISTFTLDEFNSALRHPFQEPKCTLLSEIHASLVNLIAADQSRVFGSTGASTLPSLLAEASEARGEDKEVDELDDDWDVPNDDQALEEDQGYSAELDALVRRGIGYARRWDRSAKLKSADGRSGWEKYVIGALCQRGGPLVMPNLTRILAHLLEGAELSEPLPLDSAVAEHSRSDSSTSHTADVALGNANPMAAYLTLGIEDKIDILGYLCALAMGSKVIRAYIDESETRLTELRKQRADVNKERKALLEQRGALDPSPSSASAGPLAMPSNGNGSLHQASAFGTTGEENEDQLADDDDVASSVGLATPALGAPSSRASSVETSGTQGTEKKGARSARQRATDGKKAREEADRRATAQAEAEANAVAGQREADRQRSQMDDELLANGRKDDLVEREFRRWQGVIRCRPLGKDRFFCRYWWFDGVGGMDLATSAYSTGRLFVQGPSQEDWDFITRKSGQEEAQAMARRTREEGADEDGLLGIDEWAYYESEAELDSLQTWLNAKGTRELSLKNALAKWRGYILSGSKKRLSESSGTYIRAPDARRSTRAKNEPEPFKEQYLNWSNALAKY